MESNAPTEHELPASVIEQVDILLRHAIDASASDIHLEPTQHGLRIRFRIDGVLHDQPTINIDLMLQIISRIKILAHLNIAEKRIPQDGQFQITIPHDKDDEIIDLRISTFPSIYGEKIVIRILDRSTQQLTLQELGFAPENFTQFNELIDKSSGFLLVTGPTGSGKTTTLYAALNHLNHPESNIMTLEDPVEYHVDGIVQGHIHPDSGFTFAKAIRSLLRQDPDIALIGEIRDKESARIAIEAALTGHLVLSTLHTTNAPGAIMRLMDMGIEPFLINAAVSGVLAQRLARTICESCKISYTPSEQEQALMKTFGFQTDTLYKGTGCDTCMNLGLKGRIGIFELLRMTSSLRSLIVTHPNFDAIKDQACTDGMNVLLQDGLQKVKDGVISLQELMRLLG